MVHRYQKNKLMKLKAEQTKTIPPISIIQLPESASPDRTNIQDIHTMYNSELSLVPRYESVKSKKAWLNLIFIILFLVRKN